MIKIATSTIALHLSVTCRANSRRLWRLIWWRLYMISMKMRPTPPTIPAATKMKTPAMFFRPNVAGVFSSCSHCCSLLRLIHFSSKSSMKPPFKTNQKRSTASNHVQIDEIAPPNNRHFKSVFIVCKIFWYIYRKSNQFEGYKWIWWGLRSWKSRTASVMASVHGDPLRKPTP